MQSDSAIIFLNFGHFWEKYKSQWLNQRQKISVWGNVVITKTKEKTQTRKTKKYSTVNLTQMSH